MPSLRNIQRAQPSKPASARPPFSLIAVIVLALLVAAVALVSPPASRQAEPGLIIHIWTTPRTPTPSPVFIATSTPTTEELALPIIRR